MILLVAGRPIERSGRASRLPLPEPVEVLRQGLAQHVRLRAPLPVRPTGTFSDWLREALL